MTDLTLVVTKADAERRIRAWIDAQVDALERDLATHGSSYLSETEAAAMPPTQAQDVDALLRAVGRISVENNLRPTIAAILAGRLSLASTELGPVVDRMSAEAGIDLTAAGAERPILERIALRGLSTWFDKRLSLEAGAIEPIAEPSAASDCLNA